MAPRCSPPRTPFVGSGRQPEGGFLAVHKRDFNAHVSGVAFRHCADQINMNPPLDTVPGDNVQEVLENLTVAVSNIGGMFVTVGIEGGTEGDYNVGSTYASFEAALNAAFADPQVTTTGGIVVILAGDYTMTSTVTIPAGIMLWGENGGVIINGVMSNEPMFKIETADASKKLLVGYENITQVDAQLSVQSSKMLGMTLVDNRTRTGSGIPGMTGVPMVSCQRGCSVLFDQVTFLGSINPNTNSTTYRAIGFNEDVVSNDGTSVTVTHCVIDGVSSAIEFRGNQGANDFFEVSKCRIRYFGATAGTGENNAIYTTLCNAQIEGNRINGYYDAGAFLPDSAIRLSSVSVTDDDVRFNVINNSGDSNNPNEQLRFIELSAAVASVSALKGLTARGNNWGQSYGSTDWEIIVGNDEYIGDINGDGAIDLVMQRAQLESGDRSQFTAYILPGVYRVTQSGSFDNGPRLIGLPGTAVGGEVRINLDSSLSATDPLGRKTLYLGTEIRNIKFSGQFAGEFASIQMPAPDLPLPGNKNTIIDNCEFSDCGVTFQQGLGLPDIDFQSRLSITNCLFKQLGFYQDNLSLWIPTRYWDNIDIEKSTFEGSAYMLYIGEDYRGNNGADFLDTGTKTNIKDCKFDFGNGLITDPLPAPWDQAYHKYIFVNDPGEDFTMENCTFTHDRANYDLLDQSALNAELFHSDISVNGGSQTASSFIRIYARSITINKVIAKGLWQRDETDLQGLTAYLDLHPVHRLNLTNTTIEAGFPVHIYTYGSSQFPTTDILGTLEGAPMYLVENCVLFQPDVNPGFDSISMLHIFLRTMASYFQWNISSDIPYPIPSVTVRNCSVQQSRKPSGTTLADYAYETDNSATQGKILGSTVMVSANGWNMVVENNTIFSKHPEYIFRYAAMSIWNQSFAIGTGFIWSAKSVISGNKITCYSAADTSNPSFDKSVAVFLRWGQTTFTNNVIEYIIEANGTTDAAQAPSGPNRGFMYFDFYWTATPKVGQEAILIVSNNTFLNSGNLNDYAFWINDQGNGNGVTTAKCEALFSNNVIGEDQPAAGIQRHWFNRVPHYWKVRLDQTNNTNFLPGSADPPGGRSYDSAEITYYLWDTEPWQL